MKRLKHPLYVLLLALVVLCCLHPVQGFIGGKVDFDKFKQTSIVSIRKGGLHICHGLLAFNLTRVISRKNCIERGDDIVAGIESWHEINEVGKDAAKAKDTYVSQITNKIYHPCQDIAGAKLTQPFDVKRGGKPIPDYVKPAYLSAKLTKGEATVVSWGQTEGTGTENRKLNSIKIILQTCRKPGVNGSAIVCGLPEASESAGFCGSDGSAPLLYSRKGFQQTPIGLLLESEDGKCNQGRGQWVFSDLSKFACWIDRGIGPTDCSPLPCKESVYQGEQSNGFAISSSKIFCIIALLLPVLIK